MGSGADTCEVTHRNEVFLVGRVSRPPDRRQLPSGDCLVTVHVVVDRVGARRGSRGPQLDTIECVAWRAGPRRSVQTWHRGDVVEVAGALRRRFHRVDGRPVSRYQVEIGRAQRLGRAADDAA